MEDDFDLLLPPPRPPQEGGYSGSELKRMSDECREKLRLLKEAGVGVGVPSSSQRPVPSVAMDSDEEEDAAKDAAAALAASEADAVAAVPALTVVDARSPDEVLVAKNRAVAIFQREEGSPRGTFFLLALAQHAHQLQPMMDKWRATAMSHPWRPSVEDFSVAVNAVDSAAGVVHVLDALRGVGGCAPLLGAILALALNPAVEAAATSLANEVALASTDDEWDEALPGAVQALLSACPAPHCDDAMRLAALDASPSHATPLKRAVATALLDRDFGGASALAQTEALSRWGDRYNDVANPDANDRGKYWRLLSHLRLLSVVFHGPRAFGEVALCDEMRRAAIKAMQKLSRLAAWLPKSGRDAIFAMQAFRFSIDP